MGSSTGRHTRSRTEKHQDGDKTDRSPGCDLEISLAKKGPAPNEHEPVQEVGSVADEKEEAIGKMGADPTGQILSQFWRAAGIRWIFWRM